MNSTSFLTIDPDYGKEEPGKAIVVFNVLIIMLLYSLMVPGILMCCFSMVRLLRRQGLLTSSEERVVIEDLREVTSSRPHMMSFGKKHLQTSIM